MHQGAAAAYQKFVAGLASIVARKNNADRPADMDKHTARSHYLKQLLTVTCVDWLHGVDMPLVRAAMAQFMRTARGLDLQDRYGGHFSTLVAAKASRLMWLVRMQAMRDGYACIRGLASREQQMSNPRTFVPLKAVFTEWFYKDFLTYLYVCCRNFGRLTVRSTGTLNMLLKEAALQATKYRIMPTEAVHVHSSAARGDVGGLVYGIVTCGGDVNARLSSTLPLTAMMLAAVNGQLQALQTLIKLGADVSPKHFLSPHALRVAHAHP